MCTPDTSVYHVSPNTDPLLSHTSLNVIMFPCPDSLRLSPLCSLSTLVLRLIVPSMYSIHTFTYLNPSLVCILLEGRVFYLCHIHHCICSPQKTASLPSTLRALN